MNVYIGENMLDSDQTSGLRFDKNVTIVKSDVS